MQSQSLELGMNGKECFTVEKRAREVERYLYPLTYQGKTEGEIWASQPPIALCVEPSISLIDNNAPQSSGKGNIVKSKIKSVVWNRDVCCYKNIQLIIAELR